MIRYWVAKVHKLSNTTKHSGDYRTKIISSGEMSENRPLSGAGFTLLLPARRFPKALPGFGQI